MKGKMNTSKQGKTDMPSKAKASGNGSGVTKRDSAKATGTPSGGSTLKLRSGQVTRTTGSNAKYK